MRQAAPAEPEWLPLGDAAVMIRFGRHIDPITHRRVREAAAHLNRHRFPGMIECVPAFASLTVHYDPIAVWSWSRFREGRMREQTPGKEQDEAQREHDGAATIFEAVCGRLKQLLRQLVPMEDEAARTVDIPVYYGGESGPDLEWVARHNGLRAEEVIELHSSAVYTVYMIGFAPGFPYLGGMSERIAAPRRQTPRPSVRAGSVGIAGVQTGIYSVDTPGGWQIIGHTPLKLFRPEDDPPSYLQAGDRIRFRPISLKEYQSLNGEGQG
ncbi:MULTISPECIES: 5-oxoprolinase subunit PxpB [unclassified Paenibacillus]|uniref:5-oxoprolinase subunit PxpB n=1 Tax=unclassified Paenibacillus TaxID=185978 RepID=UPI000931B2DF|nr:MULTISPECIES: 5-oxoprolinase subunit PxpB [unclassified Paenibacillus]